MLKWLDILVLSCPNHAPATRWCYLIRNTSRQQIMMLLLQHHNVVEGGMLNLCIIFCVVILLYFDVKFKNDNKAWINPPKKIATNITHPWEYFIKQPWCPMARNMVCRNPSFRLATKARGLQCHGPRRVTRESLHMLPGVQGVWGHEPSHSQGNSHVGSWSPKGLPNF
jgi:hypothetical protein